MPEVDIPIQVVSELDGTDESLAIVHLEIITDGRNLQYQWLRDGRPIPGAVHHTLIIRNPGQCSGDFSCSVKNLEGVAPLFTPVQMPISLLEARERYAGRKSMASDVMPIPTDFRLTCICGHVRTGCPGELCKPCVCGLQVCGAVTPLLKRHSGAAVHEAQ